ncbi:hypothetical protein SKAU_G00371910 [Synaphobranchus kaupii]|uniref:Uncharacterized protein n=1 Tax=Synaphobranchus kaupii TaxID=118154 RepID=A0A9Q1EG77_SYNKA|nr:hypothetical protein SKAU_G00371910 [Synaphobranchus kaupii]
MMFYSKVLLLSLAFYLLLEEASAFLLPDRVRQKRDSGWLHPSELSDQLDTFPGDSTDDAREWGTHHSSFPAPLERLSVHHDNTLPRRKPKDKRKRVTAPLDTIGGSLLSNLRSTKDEPEEHWEYYNE